MEQKIKHLEFIQAVVNRMANTSFLLKGWSVTVVAGLFALSTREDDLLLPILTVVLTLAFWFLDAYYLWQERLFRALYDEVRKLNPADVDFSMDAWRFVSRESWYSAPFSKTLLPFYGPITAIIIILIIMR